MIVKWYKKANNLMKFLKSFYCRKSRFVSRWVDFNNPPIKMLFVHPDRHHYFAPFHFLLYELKLSVHKMQQQKWVINIQCSAFPALFFVRHIFSLALMRWWWKSFEKWNDVKVEHTYSEPSLNWTGTLTFWTLFKTTRDLTENSSCS